MPGEIYKRQFHPHLFIILLTVDKMQAFEMASHFYQYTEVILDKTFIAEAFSIYNFLPD